MNKLIIYFIQYNKGTLRLVPQSDERGIVFAGSFDPVYHQQCIGIEN
jgi:hypothetical protein